MSYAINEKNVTLILYVTDGSTRVLIRLILLGKKNFKGIRKTLRHLQR